MVEEKEQPGEHQQEMDAHRQTGKETEAPDGRHGTNEGREKRGHGRERCHEHGQAGVSQCVHYQFCQCAAIFVNFCAAPDLKETTRRNFK